VFGDPHFAPACANGSQSADTLEAESGYTLASQAAFDFQRAILGGRWSEALVYLPELGIASSRPPSITPSIKAEDGVAASSSTSINELSAPVPGPSMTIADQVRFMISQQKYLEYLELGQQKKALATLRQELAPKARDPDDLHRISR
jgi:hypothetical protein